MLARTPYAPAPHATKPAISTRNDRGTDRNPFGYCRCPCLDPYQFPLLPPIDQPLTRSISRNRTTLWLPCTARYCQEYVHSHYLSFMDAHPSHSFEFGAMDAKLS